MTVAPPTNPPGLYGNFTPTFSIYYPLSTHTPKPQHTQALAWSVEDALQNITVDAGNLPPFDSANPDDHLVIGPDGQPVWMPQELGGLPPVTGGQEDWHLVLVDDGQGGLQPEWQENDGALPNTNSAEEGWHLVLVENHAGDLVPVWEPHEDGDAGTVGWHEISRGTFHVGATIDINKQIAQPNSIGDPGEAAHEHTNPYSKPFIHLFVDAAGDVLDLAGNEFIWEETDAIEYRVTATIDGTEYQSDSMKGPHNFVQVEQSDGSFITVGSWIFSADDIPAPADVGDYDVEIVVEAFGEGGDGTGGGCEYTSYDEWRECGSAGVGGSGGGNVDLQPLLDRIAALEALHDGTWEKHTNV